MEVYTMENWAFDREFNAQVGQLVTSEVFYELRDCVPPTTYKNGLFQVGEAYTHDKETLKQLYATFERTDMGWKYIGLCAKGERTDRTAYGYGC